MANRFGTSASESLTGTSGDDLLIGFGGDDSLDGAGGYDAAVYTGDFADYTVDANSVPGGFVIHDTRPGADGSDTVVGVEEFQFNDVTRSWASLIPGAIAGTNGMDFLQGNTGADTIYGLGGDDQIEGLGGDDELFGGAGWDGLVGGEGNDFLDGGEETDAVFLTGEFADYDIQYVAATNSFEIVHARNTDVDDDGTDTVTNVEYFIFADGAYAAEELDGDYEPPGILVTGTEGNDVALLGDFGPDTIYGLGGNDDLYGYERNDLLDAGEGDDSLEGGEGDDTLIGGLGNDTAYFEGNYVEYNITYDSATGTYTLGHYCGCDGLDVVTGVEVFEFNDTTKLASELIPAALLLDGTADPDFLIGEGNDDTLNGEGGDDTLDGWGGNDQLNGGADFDLLNGYGGNDTLDGGYGLDTAYYGGNFADYTITYYAATETFDIVDSKAWRDGADVVTSVETFAFADAVLGVGDLVAGISVTGTSGVDSLLGDGGHDTIKGLAGHDKIKGFEGGDSLVGDSGNDSLEGGRGNDSLYGGNDNDTLVGGDGDDLLSGGTGEDIVVINGNFADYIVSYDAATRTYIINGCGCEGIDSVTGVETFRFADGDVDWGAVTRGNGGDGALVKGTAAADASLHGAGGYDTIVGYDGADQLDGKAGGDQLRGDGGNDTLTGGAGNDTLDGGAGTDDVAKFTDIYANYYVAYNATTREYTVVHFPASGQPDDGVDFVKNVEWFEFGGDRVSWADVSRGFGGDGVSLTGTAGADTLAGGTGWDTLSGAEGADSLSGNEAADRLSGNAGADTLAGGAGDDILDGGADLDRAKYVGAFADYFITYDAVTRQYMVRGDNGTAVQDGTDYVKNVEVFEFAGGVLVDWGKVTGGNGGDGNLVKGTAAADTISGGVGYDTVVGYDGADSLSGGDGGDFLRSDGGADTLRGERGNDTLDGGLGTDTAYYTGIFADYTIEFEESTRQYRVIDNRSDPLLNEGMDLVSNVELFQFFDGTQTWTDVDPGEGDGWSLKGTTGADTLQGGDGFDTLLGLDGDDVLTGSTGNDSLSGSGGNDTLSGDEGDDTVVGGGGSDVLEASPGTDVLRGGTGADTFRFFQGIDPADLIEDFNALEDLLRFDTSNFAALTSGPLAPEALQSGAGNAALTTDVRFVFDTTSGNLYYDEDGSGAAAAVHLAVLSLSGMTGTLTTLNFDIQP